MSRNKEDKKAGQTVKTDCILYEHTDISPICRGLNRMYCRISEKPCSFYKPKSEYNKDGTRKGGDHA